MEAFDRSFHPQCFACKACKVDLAPLVLRGEVPPTREGLLFCPSDYKVGSASCNRVENVGFPWGCAVDSAVGPFLWFGFFVSRCGKGRVFKRLVCGSR